MSRRLAQARQPAIFLLSTPAISCTLSALIKPNDACAKLNRYPSTLTLRIGISMPEAPKPALEAETIRRMASEQVMISLTQAEVEELHNLLNSLLEEIRQISQRDRAGVEPESGVVVQEWPE
jgi:hypothetical protein